MQGIAYRKNLMINGSVDDLDDAFCIGSNRENPLDAPLNNDIHMDLCYGYNDEEKDALKAFLSAW